MFWKKGNRFYHTLVFRLTIRYVLFFTAFNIVLFSVIFIKIKNSQDNLIDKTLIAKIKTAIPLVDLKDYKRLSKDLHWKSVMEENKSCFYLVVDSNNTIIATSLLQPWGNIQFVSQYIPKLPDLPPFMPDKSNVRKAWTENKVKIQPELVFKGKWLSHNYILFKTLDFINIHSKARVAFAYIPNKSILIAGASLKENEEFLNTIGKIFFYSTLMMILFGSLLGYFIAKKSMVDVVKVTNAAECIRIGNLSLRVKPGSNSLEIKNLANAFNNMLERIEKLITEQKEMTNNIAHDLRSPITSIRGITETTLSGKQSIHEYHEMSGQVIDECDRLINMINSTLDIAEIETGTFEIPMERINIQELISAAYEMYFPVAEQKSIHFVKDIPQDKTIIQGNKPLLQRAIANILDNAIKYTRPEGEVTIKGYTQDHQFLITVSDSGIGIPMGEQNRIFEKFYRVEKSRSDNGNGLGLSLAHAYVLAHKGTINVISKPGQGSTFEIYLPLTNQSSS